MVFLIITWSHQPSLNSTQSGINFNWSYYSSELWRNSEHVLRITNTDLSIWVLSHNSDEHYKGVKTQCLRSPSSVTPTSASSCGNRNITARIRAGPQHKGDTDVILCSGGFIAFIHFLREHKCFSRNLLIEWNQDDFALKHLQEILVSWLLLCVSKPAMHWI